MSKKWKILTLIFLSAITVTAYVYYQFNRKNNINDRDPVYEVGLNEILIEFSTNQVLAEAKYIGKIILISGPVKSLEKDEQGNSTLVLGEDTSLSAMRISMDSTFSEKSIKNKKALKIKGVCTGYNTDEMGLGSDLILNKGIIIND